MKVMLTMIAVGILICTPIILLGNKYADGPLTDNTYNKSVQYDETHKLLKQSDISWSTPACNGNNCTVSVMITPVPEEGSLNMRIFRPAEKAELLDGVNNRENIWQGHFTYQGDGWYIYRVDYVYDGILMYAEDRYFLRFDPEEQS